MAVQEGEGQALDAIHETVADLCPAEAGRYDLGDFWHGWSKGDARPYLMVGRIPERKSVALLLDHETHSEVLGYFSTEEKAQAFIRFVDWLLRPRAPDEP